MTQQRRALHWANVNEAGFLAGMKLMFWICRSFGRWPFRLVLYPVVCWYILVRPGARRASQTYLERIRCRRSADGRVAAGAPAEFDRTPLSVLRHFSAFAETMLDRLLLWSGQFGDAPVALHGADAITSQIASGRGALLLCAHFGNLDLCRVLAQAQPNLKLTLLVHSANSRVWQALQKQVNPASQMNLMQVTDMTPATAVLLAQRIERGEFVVMAADRIPVSARPRVAGASFLGQQAPFPVGPYVLASILECPVYTLFSLQRNGRYTIHFEMLEQAVRLPRRQRDQILAGLAQAFANRLELYCLQAPLQWFNFYNFWQLSGWNDPDAAP